MKKYVLILSAITLFSCQEKEEKTSQQSNNSENEKIEKFFEKTFKEDVDDSPMMLTRLGKKE